MSAIQIMRSIRRRPIASVLLMAMVFTGVVTLEQVVGASGNKVEISFWTWSPAPTWTEGYRKMIDAFEKQYPDISVKLVVSGDYLTSILVRAAGGVAPDVMQVAYFNFKDLARAGLLMELDGLIEKDKEVNLKEFLPIGVSAATYNGKLFGLPYSVSRQVMACRKELFDESGVEDPVKAWGRGEWNWLTLREMLKKITKRSPDGRVERIGMVRQVDEFDLQPWIYGAGGSILNKEGTRCVIDNDGVRNAIGFLLSLEYQDRTAFGATGNWWGAILPQGRFGLWPQWCSIPTFLRQYDYSFDIVPHPRGPVNDVTTAQIHSMAISSQTKHPKEAWEFLKFVTMKEGMKIAIENNVDLPGYAPFLNFYIEAMLKRGIKGPAFYPKDMPRTRLVETVPNDVKFRSLIRDGLSPVWRREKAPESALTTIQELVNQFFTDRKSGTTARISH